MTTRGQLTLGTTDTLGWVVPAGVQSCPVHRSLNKMLGLLPLDATAAPHLEKPKMPPDVARCLWGRGGVSKMAPNGEPLPQGLRNDFARPGLIFFTHIAGL